MPSACLAAAGRRCHSSAVGVSTLLGEGTVGVLAALLAPATLPLLLCSVVLTGGRAAGELWTPCASSSRQSSAFPVPELQALLWEDAGTIPARLPVLCCSMRTASQQPVTDGA